MDLLEDLRSKIDSLDGHSAANGLQAVLRHVEIAEKRLRQGVRDGDSDFFNDTIYRTNQAYEGALKEACGVVREGTDQMRTFQLEEALLESHAITPRAKKLLENYRQEWRNPATHVHTLFFNEQDAFLTIVTVLGLVSVLVDQVVEAVASGTQQQDLTHSPAPRADPTIPISNRLAMLIEDYSNRPYAFFRRDGAARSEVELIGRLGAFLRASDERLVLEREPVIGGGLRPDLVVSDGSEGVVVEVKKILAPEGLSPGIANQLLEYLHTAGLEHGVLLIPPSTPGQPVISKTEVYEIEGKTFTAIVLYEREPPEETD